MQTPTGTTNYMYDDNGNRISKQTQSISDSEYYLRDAAGREVAIYNNSTNKIKMANIYGAGLVGRIDYTSGTKEKLYYIKDHLGSVRLTVTNTGQIISAQDYFPYGEYIRSYNYADANDKYKFTEKERDKETNLFQSVE